MPARRTASLVRPLSAATQEGLRAFLPAAASVANPVDLIASATAEQFERAVKEVAADPGVDSIIAIFIPPLVTAAEDVARAIRAAALSTTKPIIASFMGGQGVLPALAPVPSYPFPESAAVALAAVTRYGEWRAARIAEGMPMSEPMRAGARLHVERGLGQRCRLAAPAQCDALLRAAGIPTLPGQHRSAPRTRQSARRARWASRSCSRPPERASSTSRTGAA